MIPIQHHSKPSANLIGRRTLPWNFFKEQNRDFYLNMQQGCKYASSRLRSFVQSARFVCPTHDTLPSTTALEVTPGVNDCTLLGLLIPAQKVRGCSGFSKGVCIIVPSTSDPGINLQSLFSVCDIHPGDTQVARCWRTAGAHLYLFHCSLLACPLSKEAV